jgi:hypothetical protein
MRTVLKSGQKVEILKPLALLESKCFTCPADLEGIATLIKLVRKCHTAIPPSEVWLVKFDDDDEPVQREILVKLPQTTSGMSSSLARSPESRNLLAFMSVAGLSDDWIAPAERGVTAHFSGSVLVN